MVHDVLIIGSGPSGLALAAALSGFGMQVACLSPKGVVEWRNTYGVWQDELAGLELPDMFAQRWSQVGVNTAHSSAAPREQQLARVYGCLDNHRLQAHLLNLCERGTMHWPKGVASHITHQAGYSELHCQDGKRHQARLIVDTSGHHAKFVSRPTGNPAFQVAYGMLGHFNRPPIDPGSMVLMDFRDDYLEPEARQHDPSFLYAMDMGNGLYFVEETSLARRPPLGFDVLKDRLKRRLEQKGVHITRLKDQEHCIFPMGMPLPDLHQPVLAFGGAASMVHPASGYMIASVLRTAPRLAEELVFELGRRDAQPLEAARAAWQVIWPEAKRRQRHLYCFGLEVLLKFTPQQQRDFFHTFFSLPPTLWQGYLSGTLSSSQLKQAMWQVFWRAPAPLKGILMRSALGPERNLLWQAFAPAARNKQARALPAASLPQQTSS